MIRGLMIANCSSVNRIHEWNDGLHASYCSNCWVVVPYAKGFSGVQAARTERDSARTARALNQQAPREGRNNSNLTPNRRMKVIQRDGPFCRYCGRGVVAIEGPCVPYRDDLLTIDHVVSRALSGNNGLDNLVVACAKCNNEKGDEDWSDRLKESA